MSAAGKYPHRVQLQRNAAEPATDGDAVGEVAADWQTLAPRWASVGPLSGREYFAAQQAASDVTHTVRLRGDSITKTLRPNDRVLFKGRPLNITSVRNRGERGVEIELACIEPIEPTEE